MSSQVGNMPIEITIFRKGLVIIQASYLLSLLSRFNYFYSQNGWIKTVEGVEQLSLFSLFNGDVWRWFLLLVLFGLFYFFYVGKLNRFGLLALYLINLSFYSWNPYLIHEPQPLLNLFFISFFFLPINSSYKYDPWIKNILILFLGIYYFLAGIKKIPDPNFLNGTALENIISWGVVAKNLSFNLFLKKYFLWGIRLMNYLTLFFEFTFIFVVFTNKRKYYILFGLLLHTLIQLTLEVGNLSFVMYLWYVLLLDKEACSRLLQFISMNKLKSLLRN